MLSGIMLLVAKGCATAVRGRKGARLDIVPLDLVVNAIICAAWHVTLHRDREVTIYNFTSNARPFK